MNVDQKLYDAALDLLSQHLDSAAAACYLEDGSIITGISTEAHHAQVCLCAETGPLCEAQKARKKIVASICLSNSSSLGRIAINPPCGICQERLFWFGGGVQIGVPKKDDVTTWDSIPLSELQPHWWYQPRLAQDGD